ncbi:PLP-dependent transferase [Sparassis crispa]|uniref:PLP-dependent transferase n=1 Tax=Sparassis crispa TaxID=139825 RepID=A0A401GZR5_9APHY|nr:PLP-dependent transferase [Sparassis crispa]GBE87629.1 PLP-dependent transferase [Sparassis crispa]
MASRIYEPSPQSEMHAAVSSCFLGPQAENFDLLKDLFIKVVEDQANARRAYHPEDGIFITTEIKESAAYQNKVADLRKQFSILSDLLNTFSVPFYSPRYAAHMTFDTSMPAILGWLLAGLFNPNNITFEASPMTTLLEIDVGNQLCEMLGYKTRAIAKTGEAIGWGHIACDGTVANLESMWAARNLKFYALSLREAMEPGGPLAFIADRFKVGTCARPNELVLLTELSVWELLNLRIKDILDIPERLSNEFGITSQFLEDALGDYLIQSTAKDVLEVKYGIQSPQYLVSSTKHYSWPKSGAIAGIGSANVVDVPVDTNARVDLECLKAALEERYQNQQAVYAVVAIIGSTEEGAVDPLDAIVKLRDMYEARGMSFVVHADAAWGGYFASMIRDKPVYHVPTAPRRDDREFVPSVTLRPSTVAQFHSLRHADSITIDPHKSGYVPYPAGGLCYRDGRMRFLLTWTAPYLPQGTAESIGLYGVEGSKPGAAAAAVYLHNTVVGLHKEGHGGLLGEVSFTCRRLSAHWAAMSDDKTDFVVVPLNPLPDESTSDAVAKEKEFIRSHILGKSNEEIWNDKEAMKVLCQLGSDLNINAFACNFRINGKVNEDVEEANYLNKRIFERLSITTTDKTPQDVPIFISSSVFEMKNYGKCATRFKERLGLETRSEQDLFILRNVVMSPFQTAGDFVQKLADIFQGVLEDEVKNVVHRNTISPQRHAFIMQGTNNIYLVYRSLFHKANSRFQLIVSANIEDAAQLAQYQAARKANPTENYWLQTQREVPLSDILKNGTFTGTIRGKGLDLSEVVVSSIYVVKERPLDSMWRDQNYPADSIPFYLYGSLQEQHVDHMLLQAPNAQLCADRVALSLAEVDRLTDENLRKGVLLFIEGLHEQAMQPFSKDDPPNFFKAGTKFNVKVYNDPRAATTHGPGLAKVSPRDFIASGTLTLGTGIFVDYTDLNREDFIEGKQHTTNYTSNKISPAIRQEWQDVMRSYVG